MITSKSLTTFTQSHPSIPADWTPTEQDILDFKQTAKEANEGIWGCTVDTLSSILAMGCDATAKTCNEGVWTTVTQRANSDGKAYWTHFNSFNNVRHQEFSFETLANIVPDPNEPIWMMAWTAA